MNYSSVTAAIGPELKELDNFINSNIKLSDSRIVSSIAKYIVNSGGKRVRPVILILMAKMFAYTGVNHIKLAAVLELIHTATLLHDDVIDNSDMRRKQISAHLKWGRRNSITAGDWLFSLAFKLTVSCQNSHLTKIIASMTQEMAKGELEQLLYKNNQNITKESYYKVIEAKTGLLFAAATESAACIAGMNSDVIEQARLFGLHLGLAFQIKDDLLDYLSDNETLGKEIGDDLLDGKITLPLILLKQRNYPQYREFISIFEQMAKNSPENSFDNKVNNTDLFNSKFAELKSLLINHGCIEDSYQQAQEQQKLALSYLSRFPENQYNNHLRLIIEQVVNREC